MDKPILKYENGKLKAMASIGIDGDKDEKNSVSLKAELEIDAFEAVNEIVKDGAPQWLKDLIALKA